MLVHGGFRHWLGSGPSGVLGLPVQLDEERLESCSEYTGLCRNLQPSFRFRLKIRKSAVKSQVWLRLSMI